MRENLRADAARVLDTICSDGQTLDEALAAAGARWQGPDRALLAELVYGGARWHRRLTSTIAAMTGRPIERLDPTIAALLVIGLYQLWQLRIPDHAAVSETVSAAKLLGRKHLAGLVNALLRRFQRERDELLARSRDPAIVHSHPDWLVAALQADWPNDWECLLVANNTRAPMWLRINRTHGDVEDYRRRLASTVESATLPGLPDALRLARPVAVDELPGFATGEVSVQDGAAQLAVEFIAAAEGQRVLDACAAPGGKCAHLLERHAGSIDVTAVDIDAGRLARVAATLRRIGREARLVCADAAATDLWWDGRLYQRILIDAPCSATGVIRRHPDIKLLRRASDIDGLARRQRGLLAQLWPLLAPGGRLVYATCSVLKAENHDVVNDFLRSQPDSRLETQLPKDNIRYLMAPGEPGFQILTGTADLDGFYYACIVKR